MFLITKQPPAVCISLTDRRLQLRSDIVAPVGLQGFLESGNFWGQPQERAHESSGRTQALPWSVSRALVTGRSPASSWPPPWGLGLLGVSDL